MSTPLIATPIFTAMQREFDPLQAGMNTFADHAADARNDLLAGYTVGSPEQIMAAQQVYAEKVGETALLVCTATGHDELEGIAVPGVAPGLAIRGLSSVLRHERQERLEAIDNMYGEATGAKRGFFSEQYKNGPLIRMAKHLRCEPSAASIAWSEESTSKGVISESVLEALEQNKPVPFVGLATTIAQKILPGQVHRERGVLASSIAAGVKPA